MALNWACGSESEKETLRTYKKGKCKTQRMGQVLNPQRYVMRKISQGGKAVKRSKKGEVWEIMREEEEEKRMRKKY